MSTFYRVLELQKSITSPLSLPVRHMRGIDCNMQSLSAHSPSPVTPTKLWSYDTVCRQAMVCPSPQRPTGSGNEMEYSARTPAHRARGELQDGAPLLLADLSTGLTPLQQKGGFHVCSSSCRSASTEQYHRGTPGALDTDLMGGGRGMGLRGGNLRR